MDSGRWIKTVRAGKMYHNEWCLPFGVQFQVRRGKNYFVAFKFLCFSVTVHAFLYESYVAPAPRTPRRNARGQFTAS